MQKQLISFVLLLSFVRCQHLPPDLSQIALQNSKGALEAVYVLLDREEVLTRCLVKTIGEEKLDVGISFFEYSFYMFSMLDVTFTYLEMTLDPTILERIQLLFQPFRETIRDRVETIGIMLKTTPWPFQDVKHVSDMKRRIKVKLPSDFEYFDINELCRDILNEIHCFKTNLQNIKFSFDK